MFIGLIQAFIFALLTVLYFSSVRPAEEGAHRLAPTAPSSAYTITASHFHE